MFTNTASDEYCNTALVTDKNLYPVWFENKTAPDNITRLLLLLEVRNHEGVR